MGEVGAEEGAEPGVEPLVTKEKGLRCVEEEERARENWERRVEGDVVRALA